MTQELYQHLGPRVASNYRQYFVNGTRTRAETIYRYVVGPDGQTPEQVATDCGLPLEAVIECIKYCERNRELLQEESAADWNDYSARNPANDTMPIRGASQFEGRKVS